jgi:hypothetical protein
MKPKFDHIYGFLESMEPKFNHIYTSYFLGFLQARSAWVGAVG